jgi:hypothetical protein
MMMNKQQLEVLKANAENAWSDYKSAEEDAKSKGLKSKERYELLKPLRAKADAEHAVWEQAGKKFVMSGLNKIIREAAPIRAKIKADRRAVYKGLPISA